MILEQVEVFMTTKKLLGLRIKELRRKRGLTQDKLSEMIDIDPKHLSRIEVGKSYPSLDALDRIRKVFHVELKDLFEFTHQGKSSKEMEKTISSLIKEASPDMLPMIIKIMKAIVR